MLNFIIAIWMPGLENQVWWINGTCTFTCDSLVNDIVSTKRRDYPYVINVHLFTGHLILLKEGLR